jgi:hypothetical protein
MPRPRHPFAFWSLALLYAFVCLFGVLVAVAGQGAGAHVLGAMIVLVFASCAVAQLGGPALTRQGPRTVRRDRVETSGGSEPAFVFPSPRAKRRASALGLGGIAIGVVGMLAITGGGPFVIAGVVVLCLVAVWALRSLRRPQVVALTPQRVVVATPTGTVEVPWTAGVAAEIYPMPTGQATVDMIGLVAADPAAVNWTRGSVVAGVNSLLSRYVVSVPADAFAGAGEDVVAAIRGYVGDVAGRSRIGAADEHDRLLRMLGETGSG